MAGLSYKDVGLVTDQMNNLGDSLLKQRMMDMEKQKLEQENSFRTKQLGLEQTRADTDKSFRDAQLQLYQNRGATNADANAAKAKAAANRTWDDTFKMFGGWVKDGIVDPQVAQDKLTQAYQAMPDQNKEAIADHPAVQAIQDNKPLWQKPTPKKTPAPAAVGTDAAAQDLEDQADNMESEDPDAAEKLRIRAKLLRDTLRHPGKTPAGLRKNVSSTDSSGNKTTYSGPAADVDAAANGGYTMKDPAGNLVKVPVKRKDEMLGKGYTLQ